MEVSDHLLEQHLILEEEMDHLTLVVGEVFVLAFQADFGLDAQDLIILLEDLAQERDVLQVEHLVTLGLGLLLG